ncbi:AtpZ/AtpI family protein [Chryseobacterium sp. 3008163]|uniref:AtpZ/AtpI family protein n=1 Tax=Chryseobacterium sp. 3008163 TaxID=2478663 RepID=UPI000F0CD3EE|nr:AtpZ/AtpI family protein [Chryseobacterium sp. 3008163]AYM99329.1 AtpZ/AtpI family protein [Chryseobacterium sp. 3008163]
MSQLQLLDIIKETLPHFDAGNPSDLIKAEKILKIHQKTNPDLQLNDIENFIEFYKDNGNKYEAILQDENLQKILKNEDFKIDSSQNNILSQPPSLREDFGNDYEENIQNYIQLNIKNNNWKNIRVFYKNYFPIISYENKDLLIDSITTKNNLVRGTIPYTDQYHLLLNQYRHSVDPDFYALQSDIDSAYFNEEILDINNDLANHQHTTQQNKVFLGKIFVALASFDAYTEELRGLLIKNSRIGAKWINPTSEIITVEKKSTRKYIEKEYGKYEEITLLVIYLSLLILISFFLYIKLDEYFWTFPVFEIAFFLLLNKRLNGHYQENPPSNGNLSTRRKIKKLVVKFFILQIYLIIIAISVVIGLGLIALIFASSGVGAVGIVFAIWIIRRIMKR